MDWLIQRSHWRHRSTTLYFIPSCTETILIYRAETTEELCPLMKKLADQISYITKDMNQYQKSKLYTASINLSTRLQNRLI